MSRVDTAWLRMDNDVNLMMIVGVWLLQPQIAYETLCERVAEKLLKYERFRQGVVRDATGAAHWVDGRGLRHPPPRRAREAASAPAGRASARRCRRACGELATTPLDPDRPLWQFRLIESYEGGSALIARVHHCIGDGIALISVMMTITDGGSDPPVRKRRAAATTPMPTAPTGSSEAVLKPLGRPVGQGRRAWSAASIGRVDRRPGRPAEGHRRLARHGARTAGQVLGDVDRAWR